MYGWIDKIKEIKLENKNGTAKLLYKKKWMSIIKLIKVRWIKDNKERIAENKHTSKF